MTLDGLRAQTEIHCHVSMRDLAKRYVSIHLMLYGLWIAGLEREAIFWWVIITLLEILGYIAIRAVRSASKIPTLLVVWLLLNSSASSVAYFGPAVVLSTQADFGLYTLAVVWGLSALATISTMYNALPTYFWVVSVPGFAANAAILYFGADLEFQPTTLQHWILPIGLFCLHGVNTVLLMWDYRDTHEELDTTRAQSLAQLRQLERMSSHDTLTDLVNRAAFDDLLETALETSRSPSNIAAIMVDLNGFKPINDTYGHRAGDAVLVAVAKRLKRVGGDEATAARLGGDEFALLITGKASAKTSERMAHEIVLAMRAPIQFEEKELKLGASVGVVVADGEMKSAADVCAAADQAMYSAKFRENDDPVFYERSKFSPRLTLHDRVRLETAIRQGEIRPHYQPKIELSSMRLSGFEALARWEHPERGLLLPGDFVKDLQELSLMPEFTLAMVRNTLRDIRLWARNGLDPGRISVNIPEVVLATQTGRDELDWLLAEFEDVRANLTFEITEDVFIARAGDFIQSSIAHFSSNGVRISLDDFGTGFASFQHLRQLRFDEMKIDTSFVAGLGSDPVATVIIEGFLSIARGLEVKVVAEGVETEAQLARLRELGCHHAQGFLFGPALPFEAAIEWLEAREDQLLARG